VAKFILGNRLRNRTGGDTLASRALWFADLVFIGALLAVFRVLPVAWASALGARLGRLLGRIMPARSRKIRANLSLALPERSREEIDRLTGEVWANAGAVMAEYPHLRKLIDPGRGRLEIVTTEPEPAWCRPGQPVVFTGAHLANWEMAAAAIARLGFRSHTLFAPLANPWLDRLMLRFRRSLGIVPISREAGLRGFVTALRAGDAAAMIIDRKIDDGQPVPFFGADKASSLLPARLALRFGAPLVPVQIERLPGARFRVTFHAPLHPAAPAQDPDAQALDLTRQIHAAFEDWIRARPGEWLCTSKIWPTAILKARTDAYTE
jgi:KDO2-lipid IV(A) lauroyltransferase